MCDPVTLSLAAGAGATYGTTLIAGTGLTTSALSVGLTVAGTGLTMASQQQARKLEEAKFEAQEQRYLAEIEEERIAAADAANLRKKDYIKKMSTFYANTAGRGITAASPSATAILSSNREILRQDLNALSLSSFEKRIMSRSMANEARLARQASSPVSELATAVSGFSKTSSLLGEIDRKPATQDPFAGRIPGGFGGD